MKELRDLKDLTIHDVQPPRTNTTPYGLAYRRVLVGMVVVESMKVRAKRVHAWDPFKCQCRYKTKHLKVLKTFSTSFDLESCTRN